MGYTYKGYKLELSKAPFNHTIIDLCVYSVEIYVVRSYSTNSILIIIMTNTRDRVKSSGEIMEVIQSCLQLNC